jgi:hypothetical protein
VSLDTGDLDMPMPTVSLDSLLSSRLPPGVTGYVHELLERQPVRLSIVRPRRSKLGDHRPPQRGVSIHRITVNDGLNPYSFLTTLLHEVAHAATWERHRGRRRVRPHGAEWQMEYGAILEPVVGRGLLPTIVEAALVRSLHAPAAATCSDRGLVLALAQFDAPMALSSGPDGGSAPAGSVSSCGRVGNTASTGSRLLSQFRRRPRRGQRYSSG